MKRASRFAVRGLAMRLAVTVALAVLTATHAWPDSLKAGYAISLAGLSVGEASLSLSSSVANYRASLLMRLSGIAGLLTGARGAAVSSGAIVGSHPSPFSYAITTTNGHASRTIRMALSGGSVAADEVKPPVDATADRVPVTSANKVGVMDPVGALVMPAPRPDRPLDPSGCDRKLAVFDGIARFDVLLSFARTENVSFEGYSGPAITCSARYVPIAGHRTSLKSTTFMADNREMEVTLAPVAGTQLLVPVKISVRTLFGMLAINATAVRPGEGNATQKTAHAQARAAK
jgi:Protein of unknown function (DUF3108)